MTTTIEPSPIGTITKAWRHLASCRSEDPELWYYDGTGKSAGYDQMVIAKLICDRCPVRAACRESAMASEGSKSAANRHGIYGGLTPVERAALHRRRTR